MPIISDLSLDSVAYDVAALTLTATGTAFAELQADSGKLEYRVSGGAWTEVDGYTSWADSQVVGSISTALAPGSYDVRITNGDGETTTLSAAFVIVLAADNGLLIAVGCGPSF